MQSNWTTVVTAEGVTPEIMEFAFAVVDTFYPDSIDWSDFLDRLEGVELIDGTKLDLGDDTQSPAIRKIKAAIQKARREA